VSVLLAVVTAPGRAVADGRAACVEAAESAQSLRSAGHLQNALDQATRCASDECPAAVRKDCTRWVDEIDSTLPSIVVRVVDSHGSDVTGVRVLVDGRVVRERLDGRAIVLDPGEHRVRVEARGAAPAEETVLASEGEKNRVLRIALDAPLQTNGEALNAKGPQGLSEPAPERPAPRTNLLPYVLIGAGAAILAGATVLELVGQADYRRLRDGCAVTHSCTSGDVSSAHTKLVLALAGLGIGVAAAGVGVTLLVVNRSSASTSSALVVAPTHGGADLRFTARF
jgi:hypothetical protein